MFLLPANLVHDVSEGVYSYEVSAGEKGLVGDSVFVFGAAMMPSSVGNGLASRSIS
jgi:hypothetical protein